MENIHKDHRKRIKKRFLEKGLDAFEDHEVLELLLFFCIPRKNTNPTAHRLLNRFGSLSGVLDAGFRELLREEGIGFTSALFITFISALTRRYQMDKHRSRESFCDLDSIGRYLLNHYIGATREHVELLLFDARMHMTDHITLHEGATNSSDINSERIAEIVFTRRASCFAIAHNHPGGRCVPSNEDIAVTQKIYNDFKPFNIRMLDHFLIAGSEYMRLLPCCPEKD